MSVRIFMAAENLLLSSVLTVLSFAIVIATRIDPHVMRSNSRQTTSGSFGGGGDWSGMFSSSQARYSVHSSLSIASRNWFADGNPQVIAARHAIIRSDRL